MKKIFMSLLVFLVSFTSISPVLSVSAVSSSTSSTTSYKATVKGIVDKYVKNLDDQNMSDDQIVTSLTKLRDSYQKLLSSSRGTKKAKIQIIINTINQAITEVNYREDDSDGDIYNLFNQTPVNNTSTTVNNGIQKIHHFTILAPSTVKVGEAFDITVEARDKNNNIIPTYRGSVFFQSDTDFGATIPAQGRSVQFKETDYGSLKLSKAVIFKRSGYQNLMVTELFEDAVGSVKIRVINNVADIPMCTKELKMCENGSYVSRSGPSCNFAECPSRVGLGESGVNNTNLYVNLSGLATTQYVSTNALRQKVGSVTFTAGNKDVYISNIVVTRSGLGRSSEILDISASQNNTIPSYLQYAYDINTQKGVIYFTSPLKVSANSTQTIDILVSLSAQENTQHQFTLTSVQADANIIGTPVTIGILNTVANPVNPSISYITSNGLGNTIVNNTSFSILGSGFKDFKRIEMTHSSMDGSKTLNMGNIIENYNGTISDTKVTLDFRYGDYFARNYIEKYTLQIITTNAAGQEVFSSPFEVNVQDDTRMDRVNSSISVDSPNGGESMRRGISYNIVYSYTNNPKNYLVRLKLFKGDVFLMDLLSPAGPISTGPYGSNGGSLPWTIPSALALGNNYKIQVSLYGSDGMTLLSQDISSSPFAIVSE